VEAAKPRGLVVVSAHWENEDGSADVKGELERYQREESESESDSFTRCHDTR
jgi:aromatic ring-opening dioxygenase catalytic subunit (LigB family)